MHMLMESLLTASTEYDDGSSPGSLHTQQITLKSIFLLSSLPYIRSLDCSRTLIATIKDFGSCPCPRCLIPIDQIQAIGREEDRKLREESCRRDDAQRQKKVDDARRSLYDEGYAITGDHVDGLLKEESLVPTKVIILVLVLSVSLNTASVERLFSSPLPIGL